MFKHDDTIVALVTPSGRGALGVVRLSGPSAFSIVSQVFVSPRTNILNVSSHTLHHGWIFNETNPIDEVVVSVFKAPSSYTGEDVIEVSCHGSPSVLSDVLLLLESKGARHARPGEFTERAYLNGKMDLAQAEAVADLISAQSQGARRVAGDQLRGILSNRIGEIRRPLLDLLARMEANLDFVEEDIPNVAHEKVKENLSLTQRSLEDLLSTSLRGRVLREGINVTVIGKPNVGKSSLFNALLARDRAIVTDVPGTTRDTLEEAIEWDRQAILLTDTAGLRETTDVVEELGTNRAHHAKERADVLLLVLDGSAPLATEDQTIFQSIDHKKTILVLNKIDKGVLINEKQIRDVHGFHSLVRTSATQGQGLAEIKSAVLKKVEGDPPLIKGSPVLTNQRHVTELEEALKKIKQALYALEEKRSEESVALDIRGALDHLAAITGENVTEDVLSAIFRQFCVGK